MFLFYRTKYDNIHITCYNVSTTKYIIGFSASITWHNGAIGVISSLLIMNILDTI